MSRRWAMPARCRSRARRRCRASTRCARISRSGSRRGFSCRTRGRTAAGSRELGTTIEEAEPTLAANAMSASAMWAANAATVSPAPDTRRRQVPPDGREPQNHAAPQPRMAGDAGAAAGRVRERAHFAVHRAGSAGVRRRRRGEPHAARRRRTASRGVEIFVYGVSGGAFPARQHIEASKAIARLHRLDPARTMFAEQSEEAIAAGAFHNDVVAVANERVLFAHELAFADKQPLLDACSARRCRASNMSRSPPPTCRSTMRSDPICSTRSWSRRRTAR